jgi:uncharacterized protein
LAALTTIALILFALLALTRRQGLRAQPGLAVLFFAVFFLDNLLILLPNRLSSLQIIPNTTWDGILVCGWSGKLYSIGATLGVLWLVRGRISRQEVGLTMSQLPGSLLPALGLLVLLCAWAVLVGVRSPKGSLDLRTLLYLAFLPGLNEELVYRGLLFSILLKMGAGSEGLPAPAWSLLLSSLLFALLHGFWLDPGLVPHLEPLALRNSFVSGLAFGWLRWRTGSLVLPVAAHGLEDVLFFLPRMV